MYHERTPAKAARKRMKILAGIVVALVLAAVCWFGYLAASDDMREQGAASIRNAILASAKQCCAIEGSYPSSIEHLEKSYGLVVNHGDYIVTYEAFADNVMPSVVVVPR